MREELVKFDAGFVRTSEALDEFGESLKEFNHDKMENVFLKLKEIYDSGDDEVRYKIVFDLISYVRQEYGSYLVDFLIYVLENEKSDLIVHEAAFGLGELGVEEGKTSLEKKMTEHRGVLTRHECAISLASIGNSSSLSTLEKSLENEKDQGVISSIKYAIRHIKFQAEKKKLENEE